MLQEHDKWIKSVKESLSEHEEPLPEKGWDNIIRDLNKTEGKKAFAAKWPWMAVAAAAVVLLALVITGNLSNNTPLSSKDTVAESIVISDTSNETPDISESIYSVNQPEIHTDRPSKRDNRRNSGTLSATATAANEDRAKSADSEVKNTDIGKSETETDSKSANSVTDTQAVAAKDKKTEQKQTNRELTIDDLIAQAIKEDEPDNRDRIWSVNAGISGQHNDFLSGYRSTDLEQSSNFFSDNVSSDPIPMDKLIVNSAGAASNKINLDNHYSNLDLNYKHHQPLSFGLTVNKFVSNTVSVGTGLVYTLLSSDVISSSNQIIYRQKVHYMGVPINIQWDFFTDDKISTYISGSGMVEKCVSAKVGSDNVSIKPLSWSLSGGVGAQYMVLNRTSIYLEAGASYYFPVKSQVITIRDENKFNLKFQGGFRFFL
ncbi:MAG: hypothetical protein PHD11_04015 [Bacteroidales bacterium]|nr:hypothetical protein [Bacteroidales bacterium]MDD4670256.1 hypothetical protein [Bacteroidales bacterium]